MSYEKITTEIAIKNFGMNKDNLNKLGIFYHQKGKFKTLNDILKTSDGMVIGESQVNANMKMGNGSNIKLVKGEAVVMPLGQYVQGKKNRVYKPYKIPFSTAFNRYRGEDLNNKKLLIWRTGGLGDIIVSQSVCKALKDKYPNVFITFATSEAFAPIFYSWPQGLVDDIAIMPFKYELMKSHDYHMTFIHAVENCLESTKMNFFEIFQKISCIDYDIKDYASKLIPIQNITKSIRPYVKPNTIVVHMNSSTRLRHVPTSLWAQVFKRLIDLGYNIGLIDNPAQADKIASFIASSPYPKDRIYNLALISRDVNYAVAICDLCVAGICVDSGIGHIVAALNKPGVTLCGPYTPHNITGNYTSVVGIAPIDWNECNKYPCNYNAQEHLCPYLAGGQGVGCLKAITTNQVIDAFLKQLEFCNAKQKT